MNVMRTKKRTRPRTTYPKRRHQYKFTSRIQSLHWRPTQKSKICTTSMPTTGYIRSLSTAFCNDRSRKMSHTSIDFLNIQIHKGEDGFLQSDLYRKETSVNSLLHASSTHPRHLKDNITYGQFLRAKFICSEKCSYQKQADELQFEECGYSGKQ
ncbi:uncharacterized protein LOC143764801 [Ranitomeya variabilis]|uniref:uncharacterized protein LOC143764801 n=1 Tax=Ranitomeya variabilis TaxID=490064 RepID=UPI0040562C1A